jgi:hypothetical protein
MSVTAALERDRRVPVHRRPPPSARRLSQVLGQRPRSTLTAPGQRANAAKLAAVDGAIRARHGLVTPRWLTAAVAGQEHLASPWFPKPPFVTDDEAIALALTYDGI